MNYLINRLREPSTWAGLGLVLTQAANAWATRDPGALIAAAAGAAAILTPERRQ